MYIEYKQKSCVLESCHLPRIDFFHGHSTNFAKLPFPTAICKYKEHTKKHLKY